MNLTRPAIIITILLIVFVGIIVSYYSTKEGIEGGIESNVIGDIDSAFGVNQNCPNVIMEVNGQIHLYNTRKAKVPGVNPIQLDSLNSYPELMSYLNARGMNCPALFLRQTRGASGELEMKQLVLDPQGNLVPLWGRGGLGAQSHYPIAQGF